VLSAQSSRTVMSHRAAGQLPPAAVTAAVVGATATAVVALVLRRRG
jgi:hypothetical protein